MKKTLYLHVGHFKTGTTALQVFLSSNAPLLARHGLAYAQTRRNHGKHSSLAFSLYREAGVETLMHGYQADTPPAEIWGEFLAELRAQKEPGLIVSTEELMRLGGIPAARDSLRAIVERAPDIDFRVISYLRAPQEHLDSWYNQLVKMKQQVPAFDRAVAETMEPVHYDYALALAPWIDIFGAQAVTVRPYRRDAADPDWLFRDFLETIGASFSRRKASLPGGRDPNPRLDPRLLEPRRVLQNAGLIPEGVDTWLGRLTTHLDSLPPADTEAVRTRCAKGLQDLARDLPQAAPVCDALSAHLPERRATEGTDPWEIAEFLIVEFDKVRRKQRARINKLIKRVEALEAAADRTAPDVAPDDA